jgi:hypothetical protein
VPRSVSILATSGMVGFFSSSLARKLKMEITALSAKSTFACTQVNGEVLATYRLADEAPPRAALDFPCELSDDIVRTHIYFVIVIMFLYDSSLMASIIPLSKSHFLRYCLKKSPPSNIGGHRSSLSSSKTHTNSCSASVEWSVK